LQLPDQVRTDIALTLLWHIWKARNAKILEQQEPPAREVIYFFKKCTRPPKWAPLHTLENFKQTSSIEKA
jgi:hypothetical protein